MCASIKPEPGPKKLHATSKNRSGFLAILGAGLAVTGALLLKGTFSIPVLIAAGAVSATGWGAIGVGAFLVVVAIVAIVRYCIARKADGDDGGTPEVTRAADNSKTVFHVLSEEEEEEEDDENTIVGIAPQNCDGGRVAEQPRYHVHPLPNSESTDSDPTKREL